MDFVKQKKAILIVNTSKRKDLFSFLKTFFSSRVLNGPSKVSQRFSLKYSTRIRIQASTIKFEAKYFRFQMGLNLRRVLKFKELSDC